MRVMTWKLHRAFPELDRFSDEQCERFIRATGRSWRRVPHLVVVGLTGWVGLVLGIGGALFLGGWLVGARPNSDPALWTLLVAGLAGLVTSSVPMLFVRDRLLRARVRRVLRARSHCLGCRYSLLGMPVSEDCMVVCPECGTPTEVDPSLGELELGAAGERRYVPAPARFDSWLSERAARRLKVTLKWSAVLVFIGLPLLWGLYEVWLGHQARVAQAERPQEEAFNALVERNQPAGSEGQRNAWDVMLRVQEAIMIANSADPPQGLDPESRADFTQVYAPTDPKQYAQALTEEEAAQELAEQRVFALQRLEQYREAGVFDRLAEMAACPRAARLISFRVNEPCLNVLLPELGQMRNMARMNAARMFLAQESGDEAEWLRAFEANLALARICRSQVFLIDVLVGDAIEAMTLDRLQLLLKEHPSAGMLARIGAVTDRQQTEPSAAAMLEGERIATLNNVGWMFTVKKNVRLGRWSRVEDFGAVDQGPIGTWARNRDELNAWFDWAQEQAGVAPYLRSGAGEPPLTFRFVRIMAPAVGKAVRSYDTARLQRAGVRVMIALEEWYAAKGQYPQKLEELVPGHLARVPEDPWDGRTLKYRVLNGDEVAGLRGWGYVLYSVAGDGGDDGGAFLGNTRQYGILNRPPSPPPESRGRTYDFVINHE